MVINRTAENRPGRPCHAKELPTLGTRAGKKWVDQHWTVPGWTVSCAWYGEEKQARIVWQIENGPGESARILAKTDRRGHGATLRDAIVAMEASYGEDMDCLRGQLADHSCWRK